MNALAGVVTSVLVVAACVGVAVVMAIGRSRATSARLTVRSTSPARLPQPPQLLTQIAARALCRRQDAKVEAALPLALEAMARGLRSGASLRQAIDEASSAVTGVLAADLMRIAVEAERGTPVIEALEAWTVRRPLPGVQLAVAALALGAETGGAQARAIDGVAATLRQRLAVAAEARALATQARASAAVIAVAPLVFCALASAADPRLSAFLLRTPLGLVILAVGLALDAVGALWMARLTRLDP